MSVDTLEIVRKLEAAGTPRGQAEALAGVLRDAQSTSIADLVTKMDLAAVKSELKAEIAGLRRDLVADNAAVRSEMALVEQRTDAKFAQIDAKLTQLEQRMTIKLGTMMVVAVGAMAALVKLL